MFGKTLWFDFVPYDDPAYVTENEVVSQGLTPSGLQWAFFYGNSMGELTHAGVENLWHPLTWLSHMIDAELFGTENAMGHHAVNLLLYTLSGLLLMWVAGLLLGNHWAGFVVALLWLVHPMKVESVAWVSERKDLLSGAFFWLALGLALSKEGKWYRRIAFISFLAALFCKPSVVVLPVLLILCQGYKEKSDWGLHLWVAGLRRWWPWFLASIGISLLTIVMQSQGTHQDTIQQSSLSNRIFELAAGFWYLVARILLPLNLTYEYEHPQVSSWVYSLAWMGLIASGVTLWKYRVKWRLGFFAALWFLVCWLPASGLIYVGASFTTDRYAYLALAGPLIALASIAPDRRWSWTWGLTLLPFWITCTWAQLPVWRNGWTLFTHATETRPEMASGWTNLGKMHQDNQQWTQAEKCYREALRIHPNDPTHWFNLGLVQKHSEANSEAENSYRKALSQNENYAPALLNLGLLLRETGSISEARELFKRGSHNAPLFTLLWAESEFLLGNREKSRTIIDKLRTLKSKDPQIMLGIEQLEPLLNMPRH